MDNITKDSDIIVTDKIYLQLLDGVKRKISSIRIQVAKAASKGQFELYWWFGKNIVANQNKNGWGISVVEQLAKA